MADAGSIWARLGLDDSKFNQGVNRAEKKTKGLSSTVKKAGAAIAGAFAARAIYRGINNLIKGIVEKSDRLLDLEDITGMTTDSLQEYEYVAAQAGVSSEAVANAAQNLTQRFQNLYRESSPIARAFREMNIEAKDSQGALKGTDIIMDDVITSLAEMTNQTERNALGAQVFGGSWKELAPILSMGTEGIKEAREEAHRLGGVMDRETIVKANELRQEQERLSTATDALSRELGTALLPALTSVAKGLTDMSVQTRTLIEDFDLITSDADLVWWQKLGGLINRVGLGIGDGAEMTEYLRIKQEALNNEFQGLAGSSLDLIKIFDTQGASIRELQEEIGELEAAKLSLDPANKAELERINQLIERYSKQIKVLDTYGVAVSSIPDPPPPPEPPPLPDPSITEDQILQTAEAHDREKDAIKRKEHALFGLDDAYRQINETLKENEAAIERNYEKIGVATEAAIDWGNIARASAASIGMGMADLASSTESSVNDIIKQLLRQVTAMIIAEIWKTPEIPSFFGKLALSAGAGLMAGGLMQGLADGGNVNETGVYKIGERGPEYLTLPAGSKVTPERGTGGTGQMENVRFLMEDDIIVGAVDRYNKRRDRFG